LIHDLSQEKFKPDKFEDTYRQKILKMAEQKAAGEKVTVPSAPKRGKVIDLMSALKESLEARGKRDKTKSATAAGENEAIEYNRVQNRHAKSRRRARS
jgi:DNA end-binding protein Ku